jgi:UDP-N-acetylmuramyl pentapeptide phosphotransferase/UDP-N-acetylglucosamine-1-phosphate transferase
LAHSFAAVLAIFGFGFWESVYVPFAGEVFLGSSGILITFFWIVFLINAYNFMDGIDGIAGAQAVTAGIGWLFVGLFLNAHGVAFYGVIIALSNLAFLRYNWQPAKIFMGDVGSAFLGYTFAVMPLLAAREIPPEERKLLPLMAVILVLAFVFDSLWTLIKRLIRFEKVWEAHREHIYQKLVIAGFSHSKVTILYFVLSSLTVGLLIVWLKIRQNSGDFLFMAIFFQFIGLLSYSFLKKKLT